MGHVGVGWVIHCGSCRGGVSHSGVNGENNRCYSHLSQMEDDANRCDMSLYEVLFGVGWVM